MGTTIVVMSLTEVLIIGNEKQRDRGIKNINDFLPQVLREEIEEALTMQGVDKEIAKIHLRLTAIMHTDRISTYPFLGKCRPQLSRELQRTF